MTAQFTVGEGTAFSRTVRFYDGTNSPAAPVNVRYRIDCLTTGRTVRDWTAVASPAQTLTIDITAADNTILEDRNAREMRALLVMSNAGLATQFVPEKPYQWWVKNHGLGRNIVPGSDPVLPPPSGDSDVLDGGTP